MFKFHYFQRYKTSLLGSPRNSFFALYGEWSPGSQKRSIRVSPFDCQIIGINECLKALSFCLIISKGICVGYTTFVEVLTKNVLKSHVNQWTQMLSTLSSYVWSGDWRYSTDISVCPNLPKLFNRLMTLKATSSWLWICNINICCPIGYSLN